MIGGLAVVVALVVLCGEPEQRPGPAQAAGATSPQLTGPTSTTTVTSPPAAPGQPYRFGDVQASAPPTVDGQAPVVRRIPTDKPYIFLTIDDGNAKDPTVPELIATSGAMPTMFLTHKFIDGHQDYYRSIRDQTKVDIQNHTVTHRSLRGRPYALQHKEICGNADVQATEFGRRPTLLRPPYGNYDVNTQKAAADCGVKAIVLWTVTVNNGTVDYRDSDHLQPGDIVLLHFGPALAADYRLILERAKRAGLIPVPLPDFLG